MTPPDPGWETPFVLHPREASKALRKSSLIDPFLCARYSFSPYMACGHGCRYCDGRAEKYWVEGDFERDIVVRRNLPALLQGELVHLRERAPVAVGSGISDAYQPIEVSEKLMRDCAAILADHPVPVALLTKSSLVCRDIDLWDGLNRGASFILNLSIATLDESVRRRFEPGASAISERLETLRAFRARGIPVGVMAMPLLPFISDGEQDIRDLVLAMREAGAAFVMPAGLTLRPGRQKDFFLSHLAESFPDLVPRYREIYAEERPSGACTRQYQDALAARVIRAMQDTGVPPLLPHELFRGRVPLYDELHLLLQHMTKLYAARHVDVGALREAAARYAQWLVERKKVFNRKRSLRQRDLEADVRALFAQGEAPALLGNDKLAAFLRSVALDRKILNYCSLTLSDPPSPGG
jgi:DNA repair photolyase